MGYLDPALLSSSIDSAKCRVPSYAMAYINAMENGVDCDGPYNKLRSMIYMIKILECVQPETPGEGPVIPPSEPCPDCPDFEFEELFLRGELDRSGTGIDWTDINMEYAIFDGIGQNISGNITGPYDLTTPAGIASLETDISNGLFFYFGTASGTITLVGDVITFDISAPLTSGGPYTPPFMVFTACFYDSTTNNNAFSIASILA